MACLIEPEFLSSMSFGIDTSSQRQNRMKNSKEVPNFIDPLPQAKRARLEGTVGTVSTSGLSKASSLPQYSQDKSLPYRRTYLSYGQESSDFPSPWSPSRVFVSNEGSPVVHATTTEGSITNPVIYRHENVHFPEDNSSPTVPEDVAGKPKVAYHIRSTSEQKSSREELTSPTSVRKIPMDCTRFSPSPAEKSGGIAIPKPMYGHSLCCAGPKCTVGHSYTVDQGLQRMPRPIFEDERMAYYGHWACMQKKEPEALMQQSLLPFEHCGEGVPLKDIAQEAYHGLRSSQPQKVSAFSEPCQSKHMYNHIHPYVPFSPERCQPIQMSRLVHKDLAPMYERGPGRQYGTHMPLYQDCPLASKYREMSHRSLLYCPKNNINVYRPENFQQTSGTGAFQPYFSDFNNYYPVFPPAHAGVRNVPAYPAYRTQLDTRHMIPSTKRPFCTPVMRQVEQPLDFSIRREQNADSNQKPPLKEQLGIKGTSHEIGHYVFSNNTPLDSSCKREDNSLFNSHNNKASPTCPGDALHKKQSFSLADKPALGAVQSTKDKVSTTDKSCENHSLVIHQMIQKLNDNETKHSSFPPMPVIKKVYSLAPYKAYLAGLISPAQDPNTCYPLLPLDSKPVKDEPYEDETHNQAPQTNLDKDVIKVKTEKIDPVDGACQSEQESNSLGISQNNHNVNVKAEQDNLEATECDTKHNLVMKCDFNCGLRSVNEVAMPTENGDKKTLDISALSPAKPIIPTETNPATFSLDNIPSHCLKLPSFKIILPEVLKTPLSPVPVVSQADVENSLPISNRQARYQFMELHQSLCRLVVGCISETPNCELRNWASSLDLDETASPPAKTPKVSGLLGSKAREVWMKDKEIERALQKVLRKLEDYVRIQECPFPHVIRAGAIFIPMLVVKEVLFPQVQGTFIDQVLQEHRVELRPTTLSEERQLIQLHKRAFSSKLRRLLSLKHLPNIYPDVLTLLYYAGVCKSLGIEVNTVKQERVACSDEAESSFNGLEVCCISPRPHAPDTTSCLENPKRSHCQKIFSSTKRTKGGCKSRLLEDDTFSEENGPADESESWTFTSSLEVEEFQNVPAVYNDVGAQTEVKIESDIEQELENYWRCPLTSDDLSSESTDVETEMSSLSSYETQASSSIKKRSDMVLKLRKVFYTKGRHGQMPHYQRVSDHSEVRQRYGRGHRKRTGRRSETSLRQRMRKLSRSQHRPYPSTSHSAEHRRRWVLRSAAHNTPQTMRNRYPDLVGKRIRHLYEENDKTEVWYAGIVLRIHEAHPNPLKTVFEVKYDSEPEWQYYLELLVDYKKGWLQIED